MCNDFWQSKDLYANPINVTYNTKKEYKTAYGGLLTVISGTIILIWLIVQVVNVYEVEFTMNYVETLTGTSVFSVSQENFSFGARVVSVNKEIFSETMD